MGVYLPLMYDNAKNLSAIKKGDIFSNWRKQVSSRKNKAFLFNQSDSDLSQSLEILDTLLNFDKKGKKIFFDNSMASVEQSRISFEKLHNITTNVLITQIQDDTARLSQEISNYTTELQNCLTTAWNYLYESNLTWNEIKDACIKQYIADNPTITQKTTGKWIIDAFLAENSGLTKLLGSAKGGSYATALRNLVLIADSLSIVTWNDAVNFIANGKSKASEDESTFFNILSGKIANSYNNVVGRAGEIAAKMAELVGRTDLEQELFNLNHSLTYLDAKVTGDCTTEHQTSSGIRAVSQKGDVTVTATVDGVAIVYGISVKNYAGKATGKSDKWKQVSLGSRADIVYLAQKCGINSYSLAVYSAGRAYDSIKSLNDKKAINPTSESFLANQWEEIKNYIAQQSFLDILAGEGDGGDNVLILNVKGTIFTLDDILDNLEKRKMDYTYAFQGSQARRTFAGKNKFEPKANTKSQYTPIREKAYADVTNALKATKLKISLQFLTSLL